MWRTVPILALAAAAGCVALPELGGGYRASRGEAAESRGARLIVYEDRAVDPTLYYRVSVNGGKERKLAQGGFLDLTVAPGEVTVRVSEWWTGKGFGEDLNPAGIFDPKPGVGPDTLEAGATAALAIGLAPGSTGFLRIAKPKSEILVECASDRVSVTYCREDAYLPVLVAVSRAEAEADLARLREALP